MYRTDLIVDPDVLAAVDAQLAANGALALDDQGPPGLGESIRSWRADADAVRLGVSGPAPVLGRGESQDGVCQIGGSLLAVDAHALDARLSALANTV